MTPYDKLYIGGTWTPSEPSDRFDVIESVTEQPMASVPSAPPVTSTEPSRPLAPPSTPGRPSGRGAGEVPRPHRRCPHRPNGGAFNPSAPFGGYKQSGVGREYGELGFEEFLEVKNLQL